MNSKLKMVSIDPTFPASLLSESLSIFMSLVIATCKELGIAVIAYSYATHTLYHCLLRPPNSPLGRGLLTGQIKSRLDFEEGDFRRGYTRFQDEVSLSSNPVTQVDLPSYLEEHQ